MKTITKISPRYAETDQMGIIHHSVYPVWFEQGRMDYCKDIGFPFDQIEKRKIRLALTELSLEYKQPAHFGEELILYTFINRITKVRMEFAFQLFRNDTLLTLGNCVCAWLSEDLRPLNIAKEHPDIYDAIAKAVEE